MMTRNRAIFPLNVLAVFVFAFLAFTNGTVKAQTPMYVHYINVGQGDATLLEFPCGAILIDAGAQDDTYATSLLEYLTTFFERRDDLNNTLNVVFITHNHIDHTRVLRSIVENFNVFTYVDNGQLEGSGTANPQWVRRYQSEQNPNLIIREIADSEITELPERTGLWNEIIDPLECAGCDPDIRILSGRIDENPGWPPSEFDNKNNHSIVIKVDYGETSLLFTGDLEEYALETLVDWYDGTSMLDVDIYQVGHHGSYNATTAIFVEAMSPEMAIISCGRWDFGRNSNSRFTTYWFGHPRRTVIDILSLGISRGRQDTIIAMVAEGSRDFREYEIRDNIYATSWEGTVVVQANCDGTFNIYEED